MHNRIFDLAGTINGTERTVTLNGTPLLPNNLPFRWGDVSGGAVSLVQAIMQRLKLSDPEKHRYYDVIASWLEQKPGDKDFNGRLDLEDLVQAEHNRYKQNDDLELLG